MDHKEPVISVTEGFVDWNTFMERLFAPQDNYQCLCQGCHTIKTTLENELRRERRKLQKKLDNPD